MFNRKKDEDDSELPPEIMKPWDPSKGSQPTPAINDPRLTRSKGRSPPG